VEISNRNNKILERSTAKSKHSINLHHSKKQQNNSLDLSKVSINDISRMKNEANTYNISFNE
jgi:hypothetical protein